MFAIGNDELEELPVLNEGDRIVCRSCGQKHVVMKRDMLLLYKCQDNLYLAGLKNRDIRGE